MWLTMTAKASKAIAEVLRTMWKPVLSYVGAAYLCSLSTRYLGAIICQRTSPTIRTLEKLCSGFGVTPNVLFLSQDELGQLAYRLPMCVTAVRGYRRIPTDSDYSAIPLWDGNIKATVTAADSSSTGELTPWMKYLFLLGRKMNVLNEDFIQNSALEICHSRNATEKIKYSRNRKTFWRVEQQQKRDKCNYEHK